ncbi:MAG: DUF493 domain-containing protein [Bacteroidota bacterium]
MSWSVEGFREKLENEYTFPVVYVFKFIVPLDKKAELEEILPDGEKSYRQSKTNKYVSLTLSKSVDSSEEVIEVYSSAYNIKGIIAL